MNEATRLANLTLEKRGYLVVRHLPGPLDPPLPGKIWPHPVPESGGPEAVSGPFFCLCETDLDDLLGQKMTVGNKGPIKHVPGALYFRLVAE